MKYVSSLFNLPWSVLGMLAGLVSLPSSLEWQTPHLGFVVKVRSFWWYTWLPKMSGVRAMAIGNVVLLGPNILQNDLEHELVHVEQAMREPLIHPILYWIETIRKGYRHNKYEEEAYSKANNFYKE